MESNWKSMKHKQHLWQIDEKACKINDQWTKTMKHHENRRVQMEWCWSLLAHGWRKPPTVGNCLCGAYAARHPRRGSRFGALIPTGPPEFMKFEEKQTKSMKKYYISIHILKNRWKYMQIHTCRYKIHDTWWNLLKMSANQMWKDSKLIQTDSTLIIIW